MASSLSRALLSGDSNLAQSLSKHWPLGMLFSACSLSHFLPLVLCDDCAVSANAALSCVLWKGVLYPPFLNIKILKLGPFYYWECTRVHGEAKAFTLAPHLFLKNQLRSSWHHHRNFCSPHCWRRHGGGGFSMENWCALPLVSGVSMGDHENTHGTQR